MRATEIVRSILDLIDQIEQEKVDVEVVQPEQESGEQTSRFRQILAMLDNPGHGDYSNSPNEIVSNVDSVTVDAGGGVNGSKHPDDIRVKDPRGYS